MNNLVTTSDGHEVVFTTELVTYLPGLQTNVTVTFSKAVVEALFAIITNKNYASIEQVSFDDARLTISAAQTLGNSQLATEITKIVERRADTMTMGQLGALMVARRNGVGDKRTAARDQLIRLRDDLQAQGLDSDGIRIFDADVDSLVMEIR